MNPTPDEQPHSHSAKQSGHTRREFIQLSLMGAIAVKLDESSPLSVLQPAYTGAFCELPPGAVRPEGWLKTRLQTQADGLGSALPRVSWPFTWPFWNGETKTEGTGIHDVWGAWEQTAYWIDGAVRLGIVVDNEQLVHQACAPIDYTLSHVRQDGYIGPQNFADPAMDYYRWPHTIFFRAVAAFADWKVERRPVIAEALRRHYLTDSANYGIPVRNVTNIETMLWAYRQTGDSRLVTLAETAWKDFQGHSAKQLGYDGAGDLTTERILSGLPIDAHGVSYAEQSKLPAILYLYTGKEEYLKLALAAQQRIFDHHMLVDGIPSTSESYAGRTGRDAHETCDITDHTWNWGYQLMASGNAIWGDRIERACFNAGLGAIRKDWKGLQYLSSPNQVLATRTCNYLGQDSDYHSDDRFDYAPNPGLHIACCGGNVHRLFPNYAIRMWMRNNRDGLAATFYGPCRVKTRIGNQIVEIAEETDYPFGDRIHFRILSQEPITFPLMLRLPSWCEAPNLLVNGKPIHAPLVRSGFMTVHRTFQRGDELTLHLPMRIATSRWDDGGVAFERGPLVYSLPVQTKWTLQVLPHWSTREYPTWNAVADSDWNYALAPSEKELVSAAVFEQSNSNGDPWLNPPVKIRVPTKRVPNWKIIVDKNDAARQYTPPLPEQPIVDSKQEALTLIPYGATNLRITVFPVET